MSTTPLDHPSPAADHRPLWGAFALWVAAAITLALLNVVAHVPRPAVPLLIWSPVVAFAAAWRRSEALRGFVDALDLRLPILYHLVRVYYGAAFLMDMETGRIPELFARVAGPGDIAAGVLAIPAALLVTRRDRLSRALVLGWNALALADILAVFVTAQYTLFALRDGRLFEAFGQMPYALLPVLVVPMVIVTHGLVFLRLRRPAA
jgi:hypothetical protein